MNPIGYLRQKEREERDYQLECDDLSDRLYELLLSVGIDDWLAIIAEIRKFLSSIVDDETTGDTGV